MILTVVKVEEEVVVENETLQKKERLNNLLLFYCYYRGNDECNIIEFLLAIYMAYLTIYILIDNLENISIIYLVCSIYFC